MKLSVIEILKLLHLSFLVSNDALGVCQPLASGGGYCMSTEYLLIITVSYKHRAYGN